MAVELTDGKYVELVNYQHNAIKARNKVERLIRKIESMQCDCDGEVYEELLKIQDILSK